MPLHRAPAPQEGHCALLQPLSSQDPNALNWKVSVPKPHGKLMVALGPMWLLQLEKWSQVGTKDHGPTASPQAGLPPWLWPFQTIRAVPPGRAGNPVPLSSRVILDMGSGRGSQLVTRTCPLPSPQEATTTHP